MAADVVIIANSVIGGLLVIAAGFAGAWIRARERAIRALLSQERPPRNTDDKFDRLQQAVDAIAVEVERISEGQRFTATLLAERSATHAEPRRLPGQSITPH